MVGTGCFGVWSVQGRRGPERREPLVRLTDVQVSSTLYSDQLPMTPTLTAQKPSDLRSNDDTMVIADYSPSTHCPAWFFSQPRSKTLATWSAGTQPSELDRPNRARPVNGRERSGPKKKQKRSMERHYFARD